MSTHGTAVETERAYFKANLPEAINTPANVERCVCARCDNFDGHRFGGQRCLNREQCELLRQAGKPGLFRPRRGGNVVTRTDVIQYVKDGLVV